VPSRAWQRISAGAGARNEAGLDHYQVPPGGPGTPTSPCPCSPRPGSPSAGPGRIQGHRRQGPGQDRLYAAGDPQAADQLDPGLLTRPRRRLAPVPLVPTTPVPGTAVSLSAARLRAHV